MSRGLVAVLSLSFVFIILGCTEKSKTHLSFCSEKGTRVETSSPVISFTNVSQNPGRIYYRDSVVYVINGNSRETRLHMFNLKTSETVGHIKRGRGPGEVLSLFDFAISNDREICMLDITAQKVIVCPLDSFLKKDYIESSAKIFQWDNNYRVIGLCAINNGYFAAGYFEDCRLIYFDNDFNIIQTVNYSPLRKKRLTRIINEAYFGKIAYNEDHNSIVLASRHTEQIEICDLSSMDVRIIKTLNGQVPRYKVVDGHLAHEDDEVICYCDVRTRGDKIYALYDGQKIGQKSRESIPELRIFSWSGDLLRRVILNVDSPYSFDLCDGEEGIYLSADDAIIKYNVIL